MRGRRETIRENCLRVPYHGSSLEHSALLEARCLSSILHCHPPASTSSVARSTIPCIAQLSTVYIAHVHRKLFRRRRLRTRNALLLVPFCRQQALWRHSAICSHVTRGLILMTKIDKISESGQTRWRSRDDHLQFAEVDEVQPDIIGVWCD